MCGQVVCVSKLAGGRAGAGRRNAGGSAQPKTRTPHKDVGKNLIFELIWRFQKILESNSICK